MEVHKGKWLGLAVAHFIAAMRQEKPAAEIRAYPKLHNFVTDLLAEGRRKNVVPVLFEVDLTGVRQQLADYRNRTGESVTLTTYIAKCFASAVALDISMQAYRLGSRLVLFKDVDLTFIVEREWEGDLLPVFHIVRAAQRKSLLEIQAELRQAKEVPMGADGPMSALILQFFLLPRMIRKLVWFKLRRNPYWFKAMAGTVGITSLGMHATGAFVVLPITPMTLTLSIGGLETKLMRQEGEYVEREIVHLNLSLDHEIIDGSPTMRFIERFKALLQKQVSAL